MDREFKDRTALLLKDLGDQTPGRYILTFRNQQGSGLVYCDSFDVLDGAVIAYNKDGEPIHARDVRSDWEVSETALFTARSQRDALQAEHDDFKARKEILKSIDPEGAAQAEKMMEMLGGMGGMTLPTGPDKTGQYL